MAAIKPPLSSSDSAVTACTVVLDNTFETAGDDGEGDDGEGERCGGEGERGGRVDELLGEHGGADKHGLPTMQSKNYRSAATKRPSKRPP